jgi:arabinose-5-phosphate isomerase
MTKDEIIKIGKSVLDIESKAVESLASRLDENFANAVELLSQCESRIIVTGMGKSGLVGRKIAATMASCATPALFIHAAEAGHGDLGMISAKDVVIAISYSGETNELVSLLGFIKRIGVSLISITGNPNSKLAQYSDVVLQADVKKEAEPSGLIPTASSTAALALGDALAIALMRKKGFGEDEFASFHPKGALGKKLIKVSTLMHMGSHIPTVTQKTLIKSVLDVMTSKKLGLACVIDDKDRILGVITDGDLRRIFQKYGDTALEKTARACMTAAPVTIGKNNLATEALKLMEDHKITSLIIKDPEGRIEGILHLHDLWRTEMF